MPTIIPCADIEQEVNRLLSLFEPCYVLKAEDLDALVSLIYSVSLCEGTDLVQDNIFQIIVPDTVTTSDVQYTLSDVATAINGTTAFTIGDTELPIFEVRIVETVGTTTTFKTAYFFFIGVGAGTYGSGETSITAANLFLIREATTSTIGSDETNPPVVYEVRTSTPGDVDNPHTVVNGLAGPYTIASGTDYYFRVIVTSGGADTSTNKLYRFTGANGSYGTAGGDTAVFGDFLLIEQSDSSASLDNQITVLNYPTRTLQDSEDISDAVNDLGAITIPSTQLTSFSAQRFFIENGVVHFLTEKYFWKNGQALINADTTVDDFEFYDKEYLVSSVPITAGTPEVISVYGPDLDQPEYGVNNSDDTYVIDGTKDWYFAIYPVNILVGQAVTFKLYRWTGSNGTYGFGGSTAVNGDFTLIYEEGTSLTNPQQFYKFEPDAYLGDRYDFTDTSVNGFYFGRTVNERTGIDVFNDSTGVNATTGFIATGSSTPFNQSISMQYFSPNYFGVPLRSRGAIYSSSTVGMAFVAANDGVFEYFVLPDTNLAAMSATPVLDFDPATDVWRMRTTSVAEIDASGQGDEIPTVDWVNAQGFVTKVGTPVDNQLGVWTGDGTLEGDTNLTWSGTFLTVGPSGSDHMELSAASGVYQVDASGDVESTLLDSYLNLSDNTGDAISTQVQASGVTIQNTTAGKTVTIDEDSAILKVAKVTVNAASLKTLGSTPVELIAAPGVGNRIDVISATATLNWGSVAFDANSMFIHFGGPAVGTIGAGFLSATANDEGKFLVNTTTSQYDQVAENTALTLEGSDSVATGDSTVDIYIIYAIIKL